MGGLYLAGLILALLLASLEGSIEENKDIPGEHVDKGTDYF
ncbi:MAG: hypothetical protein N2645_12090 [Clostridia bacterium]|nr:hypothetical protein [Clostridia bacterium]